MNAVLENLRLKYDIPHGVFRLIVEQVRPKCPGAPPSPYSFVGWTASGCMITSWYLVSIAHDTVTSLSGHERLCAYCLKPAPGVFHFPACLVCENAHRACNADTSQDCALSL